MCRFGSNKARLQPFVRQHSVSPSVNDSRDPKRGPSSGLGKDPLPAATEVPRFDVQAMCILPKPDVITCQDKFFDKVTPN